jgi:L-asparaginase II
MSNPILVNTLRGEVIENRHRGAIAVCDPHGRLVHAWGDVDALVYPRSSIKSLQALPMVESGAAEHFQLRKCSAAPDSTIGRACRDLIRGSGAFSIE